MFTLIYLLSFIVVGFTAVGILISTARSPVKSMSKMDVGVLVAASFVPVINTIAALVIVVTMTWLLFFEPGSNPNPPA